MACPTRAETQFYARAIAAQSIDSPRRRQAVFGRTTRLHEFDGADGEQPTSNGLVIDAAGNLYGLTLFGGTPQSGVAFELSPTSGGVWKETVLHTFTGESGNLPKAGLTFDSAGNLWGTTSGGTSSADGAVFELTPVSGGWIYVLVYAFKGGNDGEIPEANVIFDSVGNLYSTTFYGGNSKTPRGTVFQLSPLAQASISSPPMEPMDSSPTPPSPMEEISTLRSLISK